MYNLINASFTRLRKNKLFWSIIFISILVAFWVIYDNYKYVLPENSKLEYMLMKYMIIIGFCISIFISLFVGIEHENGTIKNQIIAGHSRFKIYLSNLIVSIISALTFQIVFMIVVSCVSIPRIGGIKIPIDEFMYLLLATIMTIVSYSAFFNFVTMLCSNITISAVFCVVSVIVMFLMVFNLSATADSKEFYENTIINMDGEIISTEILRNDDYPGDFKRDVSKVMMYLIPAGTASKLSNYEDINNIKVLPIYSLITTIAFTSIGIYIFNKKDLK